MLLRFFDLDGTEVDSFFVGCPGDASVDEGDYTNNYKNDSEDLHLSSRSLIFMKMQAAAKGCRAGRRASRKAKAPRWAREAIRRECGREASWHARGLFPRKRRDGQCEAPNHLRSAEGRLYQWCAAPQHRYKRKSRFVADQAAVLRFGASYVT